MSMNWSTALLPYGEMWRRQRTLLHHKYTINESKVYLDKVEKHAL
jgi:hypothetical protein